jgi:addiction module RelB/DinJ family antitoxin
MSKSATVQARITPDLKQRADAILESLGINASTAISLFYSQIVRQRGIPLELKAPNPSTRRAMIELKTPSYRKKAKAYTSVKALMDDLEK